VKSNRIHNFNPGPSALPLSVLEEVQASFLDFNGSGMSIVEISHRSKLFEAVLDDAIIRIKRLLGLDKRFKVLFIQGGASMQFAMIPMNFLPGNAKADYINTGTWSTKAIQEAGIQGKNIVVAASSEDRNFSYIPEKINISGDASFVYMTSNNTIKGTQWHHLPETGGIPIVSDMCSDILSRKIDVNKFGMIFAGAQKNMGPAGVSVVIIREDMLDRIPGSLPSMLSYRTYVEKESMFNTPPCFAIYVIQLMMKWLEEEIGGLEKIEAHNIQKAKIIYDVIDSSDFFAGTAAKKDRSLMIVTFRLPDENLEKLFIEDALKKGLGGLKGHKSVGGLRASIYNAATIDSVTALADFMKAFEALKG
jgi:phosphoserine aminotransferase